jgi:transposase
MIKLYKFRIYPNREQIQTLTQTIEICRLLYNDPLEQRRKDKGLLSYYDQKKQLIQIKHNNDDDDDAINIIYIQVL